MRNKKPHPLIQNWPQKPTTSPPLKMEICALLWGDPLLGVLLVSKVRVWSIIWRLPHQRHHYPALIPCTSHHGLSFPKVADNLQVVVEEVAQLRTDHMVPRQGVGIWLAGWERGGVGGTDRLGCGSSSWERARFFLPSCWSQPSMLHLLVQPHPSSPQPPDLAGHRMVGVTRFRLLRPPTITVHLGGRTR